jgi:hypothetical protein
MLRPATHIRYHITAILAVHWLQFVAQYKRWIRPVVFENVRKVLACRTPVLGCHIYQCKGCGHPGYLYEHSWRNSENWSQKFFDLWLIGSVGFDDRLIDSSLASILFTSASLGGGCSDGVYQQYVRNIQKILFQFISRRHRSDLHPLSMPSR